MFSKVTRLFSHWSNSGKSSGSSCDSRVFSSVTARKSLACEDRQIGPKRSLTMIKSQTADNKLTELRMAPTESPLHCTLLIFYSNTLAMHCIIQSSRPVIFELVLSALSCLSVCQPVCIFVCLSVCLSVNTYISITMKFPSNSKSKTNVHYIIITT